MRMCKGLGGRLVPGLAVLEHGVDDYQQLAHKGG